jgi:hypothetical protein
VDNLGCNQCLLWREDSELEMTTVYFAGTEDVSFKTLGLAISTNTNFFRPAFSRCALSANNGSTGLPPTANGATTPFFTATSSFWLHGLFSNAGSIVNGTSNNFTLVSAQDSSGIVRIAIMGTGTTGQLKAVTCNSSGTLTTLFTTTAGAYITAAAGTPLAIDVFINYAVSGQVTLYQNGAIIGDTGPGVNVTTNSVTALSQACYSLPNSGAGGFGGAWSECLIQDTSTLGCGVLTLPPVAAGNTQSWTPNTVANVNPITINDTNFVSTTSANALSEWTVSTASLPAGSWTISAVVQAARVLVGTTGPQHFEWLVRTSDGSDHVTGSVAPLTSFSNFTNIWPTNPHTSAAWNAGELINTGIESLT